MLRRFVKKIDTKSKKQNETVVSDVEGSAMAAMAGKKGLGAAGGAGAAKAPEQIAFQIEVETETQWRNLCRREGLILVDVYAGWAGPCVSMISILKRVKVEVNDDRLWLAIANSDKISDLLMFKDQSEPTWLFIGGGKPVKVIRSANVPKLVATIKSEFQHELQCMQGKARRNLISIDDEVTRRKKAETEAIRLSKLVRDEEETSEELNVVRKESSVRLMNYMEPYSVLIIQNFLLETGVVTVIRDSLQGEFKIEQERMVSLNEAAVRHLFRIPYKIPDPNVVEDFGYTEPEPEDDDDAEKERAARENEDGFVPPADPDEERPAEVSSPSENQKKKKQKMLDVKLPDGLVGDTLFMLLESLDIRKILKTGLRPPRDSPLQSADDYLLLKVGPLQYKDAMEHAPHSMHALYGKGQYLPGVWCPRRYDDKRHVMIHYFPRFVTELLMPTPAGSPKHLVAVFPANQQKNVSKEIEGHRKDVFAEGKVKVPADLADKMLKSWNKKVDSEEYKQKKKAMSGDVFALSVNRKNSTLVLALQAMEPLHVSFDAGYGKEESGKLFKDLHIDTAKLPNPDEVVEKFLARSRPRIVSLTEFTEAEKPKRNSLKTENQSFAQDHDEDREPMMEMEPESEPSSRKSSIDKPKKSDGGSEEPKSPPPPPVEEPEKPKSPPPPAEEAPAVGGESEGAGETQPPPANNEPTTEEEE